MEKQCTKCHESKPLDGFNKSSQGKDGHASWCRECAKSVQAEWRRANPKAQSEWRTKNPGKQAEYNKRWTDKNPDKQAQYSKRWYEANSEAQSIRSAEYSAKMLAETSATATSRGRQWSSEDDALIMREDLSLLEISKQLGRTYHATAVRRSRLKSDAKKGN
jgi:hypothetical protein